MPPDKTDYLSHVRIVVAREFASGEAQNPNDPPAACVTNALGSFAPRPLPADRAALRSPQPLLQLVGSHVYRPSEVRSGLGICVSTRDPQGFSMTSMEVS
jgi:hypothetical protein